MVNWPLHRKVLSVGANVYTKVLLGMHVNDATAGYRVYRTSALRTMGLAGVESQGYCFQIDLTSGPSVPASRSSRCPITFVEREVGVSKMSRDIVREALTSVTRWGRASTGWASCARWPAGSGAASPSGTGREHRPERSAGGCV